MGGGHWATLGNAGERAPDAAGATPDVAGGRNLSLLLFCQPGGSPAPSPVLKDGGGSWLRPPLSPGVS